MALPQGAQIRGKKGPLLQKNALRTTVRIPQIEICAHFQAILHLCLVSPLTPLYMCHLGCCVEDKVAAPSVEVCASESVHIKSA